MSGILGGLFDGSNWQSQPGGQSIFANPNFQSIAALAAGLGQGGMPSPYKIPFGAILGQAAGSMAAGANNANIYQQNQNQAQAGQMQNQLAKASMPMQMALLQQQGQLMGLGPNGQPLGGAAGGASAPAGGASGVGGASPPASDSSSAMLTPRMIMTYAQLARLQGDSRGEAAWLQQLNNYTPERGTYIDQNGNVQTSPGAAGAMSNLAYAENLGTGTAQEQTAGPIAAARASADSQYNPFTWTAKGPDGQFHYYTGTQAQFIAANGGAGGQDGGATGTQAPPGGSIMPALQAVPPAMQTPALMAAVSAGLPPAAIPYWISSVQNESGWNPNAPAGSKGEIGIGQVMPATAQGMGIDPKALADPQQNLIASARYFNQGWTKGGGDPAKALAYYNSGDINNPDTAYVQPAIARVASWVGGQPNPPPAAQPGVEGAPDMTPEQEAISKEYGEQAASVIAAAQGAPVIQEKLKILQQQAQNFRTGSTGEMRQDAQSLITDTYQALGLTPPAEISTGAASAETINKVGAGMALDLARQMGSREAAQIVMLTKNINPNVDFTTGGYKNVLNVIGQQAQYAQDLGNFQSQWLTTHSSIAGMMDAFENVNPPEVYASRVQPLDMPSSQADAKPNVIYQTPRGPLLWIGHAFTQPPAQ